MLRPERLSEPPSGGILGPLLAIAVLAACGPGTLPAPATPPADVEPAGQRPRAGLYGGPADPVALTADEAELARLATGCQPDPRLVIAARAHADDLASSGLPRSTADLDHLRFGILAAGGFDYRIQPFIATADAAGREALAGFVGQRGASWTHFGVGILGGVLVWIGVDRPLELDAVPIRFPQGRGTQVTGRVLDPRVARVTAFLGLPDGSVGRLAVSGGSPFSIDIPQGSAGRHDLELLVDTGRGPEVAVLLPLYLGCEPERRPVVFQEPPDSGAREPARLLYELIGEVRRRAGLEPLRRDITLEALARAHSAEMIERGFFGHVSPATGSLAERLAAQGLRPTASAENVARAGSAWRAHRNLLQSPSHRMHLIDPRFTHVGVGAARDGDDVIVTEVFARW
ncbi:MAG TPA: CAP domain-containing protein [Polyangia bacterium]|nr:CAP domain-containing protein [Polyangia bacterium]